MFCSKRRVPFVLNSAIAAVEGGFSYDGIVSIPELGLEDVILGRNPFRVVHKRVGHALTAGAALPKKAVRLFISPNQQFEDQSSQWTSVEGSEQYIYFVKRRESEQVDQFSNTQESLDNITIDTTNDSQYGVEAKTASEGSGANADKGEVVNQGGIRLPRRRRVVDEHPTSYDQDVKDC